MDFLATFINDHGWSWPVLEMFHFIGMALLIGTVGIVDLRILGVGKGVPLAVLERLIPWGVAGFLLNAATGFVFIMGDPFQGPAQYFGGNVAFQVKMVLIVLAGVNLFAFYFTGLSRAVTEMGAEEDAPRPAKIIAIASLALWFGVIYFGRMIMYDDNLLYALGL
jgi:hypothetical protein